VIRISLIYETAYNQTKIRVINDSITKLKVDAIVNPANSLMKMGGGVAKVIKNVAGQEVENEAIKQLDAFNGKCPIGKAILTAAGNLRPNIKYIIHAPTMNSPVEPSNINRIKSAVRGVMGKVYEHNINENEKILSIGFPAMGTGAGKVPKNKAAQAIIDGIVNYFNTTVNFSLDLIILCDINKTQTIEFKNILMKFIE